AAPKPWRRRVTPCAPPTDWRSPGHPTRSLGGLPQASQNCGREGGQSPARRPSCPPRCHTAWQLTVDQNAPQRSAPRAHVSRLTFHASRFTVPVSRFPFHGSRITHHMSVIVTAVTGMLRLLLRLQSVKTLDSIGLLRLLRLFTPRAPLPRATRITHHVSRFTFHASHLVTPSNT